MSKRAVFDDVAIDVEGNALEGVEVTVTDHSNNEVPIYGSKTGGVKSNPFTTTDTGQVYFWAPPGSYKITMSDPTIPARIDDRIVYFESISGDTEGIDGTQIAQGTVIGNRVADATLPPSKLTGRLGNENLDISFYFGSANDVNISSINTYTNLAAIANVPPGFYISFTNVLIAGGTGTPWQFQGRFVVGLTPAGSHMKADFPASSAQSHDLNVPLNVTSFLDLRGQTTNNTITLQGESTAGIIPVKAGYTNFGLLRIY